MLKYRYISIKNVQVIATKLEPGSYSHIIVQKGIPVKWIIKAEESDLNGCNNPLAIPKHEILKKLVPGDNIILLPKKKAISHIPVGWE